MLDFVYHAFFLIVIVAITAYCQGGRGRSVRLGTWSRTAGLGDSIGTWSRTAGLGDSIGTWSRTAGLGDSIGTWSRTAGLGDSNSNYDAVNGGDGGTHEWWAIILFVFGGFIVVAGFIYILVKCFYCIKSRMDGKPKKSNSQFVSQNGYSDTNRPGCIHFSSGIWKSRYHQYGYWHGPHIYILSFDSQTLKVTGSGADDVGKFTIQGIYSADTGRLGLTKLYQSGTGNQSENFGHRVIIQLIWFIYQERFVGKWYVRTKKFQGDDPFELNLV